MKKTFRIACLLLGILLIFTACRPKVESTAKKYEKDHYLYLVAGLDDAAKNTDVLFTLSYDANAHVTRIAQIPRDTYFGFGNAQNKINQFYATKISAGSDKMDAFDAFARELEVNFGTKFDGYIGISTSVFRKLVDTLGGLDIELEEDMVISLDSDSKEILLKKGTNHIDGEYAERFVRYRSGYAMGDLGRIDAQKIFLNALFSKIARGLTLPSLIEIAKIIQEEAITNIGLSKVINLVFDAISEKCDKTTYYATLPGEPAQNANGVSYYVLNRKSTAEMIKNYMFSYEEFDARRMFLNSADTAFVNIYEDDSIKLREYTGKTLSGMHIKANNLN